jgi:UDP-glucose 4-epimerase
MTPLSANNSVRHILVTGAAGFIGSHLVDRFLADRCRVTGIDNLCRGTRRNLGHALRNPCFTFIQANVADEGEARRAFTEAHAMAPVSEVWHMAANSDIPAGIADPRVDLRDTFLTTFQTVLLMRELGITRLAFASSSAIYGVHDRAIDENVGPAFPISNYGAMKLASEGLISAALETFLGSAWIFRFPNVTGSRATHGVIYDLVRKLRSSPDKLNVLGDGSQQKPYLHVSELVDAMMFIAEKSSERLNCYNISGEDSATVRYIAEAVVGVTSPGTPIQYASGAAGWVGDVPTYRYSTEKLRRLGWQPSMTSEQAVDRAVREVCREICRQ